MPTKGYRHTPGASRPRMTVSVTACLASLLLLTGCFTGIEGTKKITLSRDDRKHLQPTAEEMLMDSVVSLPLSHWEEGMRFVVSDQKGSLVYTNMTRAEMRGSTPQAGDTLLYRTWTRRLMPDGTESCMLIFTHGGDEFAYNTTRTPEKALDEIKSDAMPMLIDLRMVEEARTLLTGRHLWTRTTLSYDSAGTRRNGRKFIEVTVKDVQPGDMVFPLTVIVTDSDGETRTMLMNTGTSGTESRSFPNLFFLTDIRNKYPDVADDVWRLIQEGKTRPGMTKEECRLSLGSPSDVASGHDYSQILDIWKYPNGKTLYFQDGLLVNQR